MRFEVEIRASVSGLLIITSTCIYCCKITEFPEHLDLAATPLVRPAQAGQPRASGVYS